MYGEGDSLICDICFSPITTTFYEVVVNKLYVDVNEEPVTLFEGGSLDICDKCMQKLFRLLLQRVEVQDEADC